ncbi:alpha-L-rhamnosidase [Naasia lichenicola]|uniref:alpha-L-rhamnosidase n=1 Tax=Naasia lichenicola TaxID=2565933 RepID=A0A4S4FGL8_9MICO|nr:alpha-L-rhamnosidase [Naasia lichenicola]THG29399.1 alpha-L-rhamnosidase [Naasia lichenicola]
MTTAAVTRLWFAQRGAPFHLADAEPTLSWQVVSDVDDWTQTSARIELRRGNETETADLPGARSQNVPWPFAALTAYDSIEVRVAVAGGDGVLGEPGEWVSAATGPLVPADWKAPFIAAPGEIEDAVDAARSTVRFRTEFIPSGTVVRAALSSTAHGVYEPILNGAVIGDEVLAPGWTSYAERLLFQTFDVTEAVSSGVNVLGATVAEGWYRERFGFDGRFSVAYPGPVALSMQLRLDYADGRSELIVTGPDWTASASGPTISASIYQGEHYDARAADDGFEPGAAFPGGQPAVLVDAAISRLAPASLPPVRRIERRPVLDEVSTPSGGTVLDFGQNLVGWLELSIDAPAGTTVTLRHAEVLEHGELAIRPLRHAAATDSFTSDGTRRTWSPRFTFHGFRYAQITGWDVPAAAVTAVVVHSDLERTGFLETSNPTLDQLHSNVVWGMKGNFLSIPTDCPQRDERLGWTGDIQVFAPTAGYLFDTRAFLGSWLRDLAIEQREAGSVPMVVPNPIRQKALPAAAWGDAATLVPDALFRQSGDLAALEEHYPSMREWVELLRQRAGDDLLWTGGFQFGDWLDPTASPHNPADAKADKDLVATAYFAHSTRALATAALALGKGEDATVYSALADDIRSAFAREYVTPGGRMMSDAHTAYTVAIAFDLLVDPAQRAAAGERLAQLVRAYDYRIRTGFMGTPIICQALHATGHTDVAYRMLIEEGLPSWLYPITMGATTIWERWDSMLPDGSVNPGEMTSFNHYALGSVADWMHRVIGGIAPASPGYDLVEIAPVPGGGLTSATAKLDAGYGPLTVAWKIRDGVFELVADIPAGQRARVVLPFGGVTREVGSGRHSFSVDIAAVDEDRSALSMETPLADILDDVEARAAIMAYFDRIGYGFGHAWSGMGMWRPDSPLGDSLIMFAEERRPGLAAVLDDLNGRRIPLRE